MTWPLKRFGSTAPHPQPSYDRAMRPGTIVRYSGKWLANTGQRTGPAGQKRFIVCNCKCKQCSEGRWICTTEKSPSIDLYSPAELAAQPELGYLHIARANLSIVGKPTHRDDP